MEKILDDQRSSIIGLRTIMNAILWINYAGAQWRKLDSKYPSWQSAPDAGLLLFQKMAKNRALGTISGGRRNDLAFARTTPVSMGLFSIVTLWTHKLQQQQGIEAKRSAWYIKKYPAFSDALALVRKQLWQAQKFSTSQLKTDV
ncbi:MAG: transposase [Cyclobacteriaceae bacterium]